MDFVVDHLLHAVKDPYGVRLAFEDRFSFVGARGGEHPDWGTYNELMYFDLSYIEWIGIKNLVLAANSRFGREVLRALSNSEGVGQFALRTHEIDRIAAQWAAKGLPFWGPIQGHRVRPDGTVIRWRLLFPGQGGPNAYALPFLIDWGVSDEERRDTLMQSGISVEQEKPVRICAIHSLVSDVDELRSRWESYFGLLEPGRKRFPGIGTCIEGDIGEVRAVFWQPESELLVSELRKHGERPFQIDLDLQSNHQPVGSLEGRQLVIDPELEALYGVRVRLLA